MGPTTWMHTGRLRLLAGMVSHAEQDMLDHIGADGKTSLKKARDLYERSFGTCVRIDRGVRRARSFAPREAYRQAIEEK